MDGGRKVIWGDLASLDHKNSQDSEKLFQYIKSIADHLIRLGFKGFRCDAAYQIPTSLWSRLISETKEEQKRNKRIHSQKVIGCPA